MREVPRSDRRDDAGGFPAHLPPRAQAHDVGGAEIGAPLEALQQIGPVVEPRHGPLELRTGGEEMLRADLRDGELADLFESGVDRLAQLTQAAGAEGMIARPLRVVERATGRGDGGRGLLLRGVGGVTDHLAGGGVEDRIGTPGGVAQLAFDEKSRSVLGEETHVHRPFATVSGVV